METLGQGHVDGEHGRGWRPQRSSCEGTSEGRQMETAEALSSLCATPACQQPYGTAGLTEEIGLITAP